jgi:hypothetical protein
VQRSFIICTLYQVLLGDQDKEYKMVEMRNGYTILVGKLEVKKPLGRPRRRWEDNIRMELKEVSCEVWTSFIWHWIGINGGLL